MKRGLLLGLLWGFPLGVAAQSVLNYLDAVAQQYVRAPGAPVAVRLTGRKPA